MKVTYSTTLLASGGLLGTTGANWNGQQINDEAAFFRAAAVSFYPRGNRSTIFGFGVNMPFNNEGAALLFAATFINTLPTQADLTVVDDAGTVAVVLANAVLDSVSVPKVDGNYVFIHYQFRGGVFTSTSSLPNSNVIGGKTALAINDESKSVTFPLTFSSLPSVVDCWVVPPTGAPVLFIEARPLYDTISPTGFSAAIGFPIPANGYWLFWEAIGP